MKKMRMNNPFVFTKKTMVKFFVFYKLLTIIESGDIEKNVVGQERKDLDKIKR
jgi:hypothetical protein